ncbi:S1 family peptidase [Streptomyces sp. bgisy154]|uniref:S1 family peptidase n=1 Tax=Streptomyces sp. bgisy154 TaxID=3413794 RepID=UPI003D70C484
MLASRPRPARTTALLMTAAAASAGLLAPAPAGAVTGPQAADGQPASVVRLTIGDEADARGCTATLIDQWWLATAASCFAQTPGEHLVPAGKPALPTTATLSDGTAAAVVDLRPRTDRDLVLARLAAPATGLAGVRRATASPQTGSELTAAGFGRTGTVWVPDRPHTGAFTLDSADATTLSITGKGTDAICKGDTGGPLLNAQGELVGVNSRSWQGGCLGTDATETRTGAVSARIDDLADWVQDVRALTPGWKAETVVQAGTGLYQGIRLADGSWTAFTDVQSEAGDIGGVRAAAVAGINGDTHVVALGGDGHLRHVVRSADGTWGTFGDVNSQAGALNDVTRVSAVSIGTSLHVVAVAGGKVYHTVRGADGRWTRFGDVAVATGGPIGTVTAVATASAGGELQLVAVSGGKAYHTVRRTSGVWTVWGDVARAAGATGPVTAVTMAGAGSDAHLVIATDGGSRQYHAMRYGNGTWAQFGDLKGYLGAVTATSVGAGTVDGELQLAVTTADGRILHIVRHTDRTWSPAETVTVRGVTGTLGPVSLAGTL